MSFQIVNFSDTSHCSMLWKSLPWEIIQNPWPWLVIIGHYTCEKLGVPWPEAYLRYPPSQQSLSPKCTRNTRWCQDAIGQKWAISPSWVIKHVMETEKVRLCNIWTTEVIGKNLSSTSGEAEPFSFSFKGAQAWDIRSLGFSWFLHHKVSMCRRLRGLK